MKVTTPVDERPQPRVNRDESRSVGRRFKFGHTRESLRGAKLQTLGFQPATRASFEQGRVAPGKEFVLTTFGRPVRGVYLGRASGTHLVHLDRSRGRRDEKNFQSLELDRHSVGLNGFGVFASLKQIISDVEEALRIKALYVKQDPPRQLSGPDVAKMLDEHPGQDIPVLLVRHASTLGPPDFLANSAVVTGIRDRGDGTYAVRVVSTIWPHQAVDGDPTQPLGRIDDRVPVPEGLPLVWRPKDYRFDDGQFAWEIRVGPSPGASPILLHPLYEESPLDTGIAHEDLTPRYEQPGDPRINRTLMPATPSGLFVTHDYGRHTEVFSDPLDDKSRSSRWSPGAMTNSSSQSSSSSMTISKVTEPRVPVPGGDDNKTVSSGVMSRSTAETSHVRGLGAPGSISDLPPILPMGWRGVGQGKIRLGGVGGEGSLGLLDLRQQLEQEPGGVMIDLVLPDGSRDKVQLEEVLSANAKQAWVNVRVMKDNKTYADYDQQLDRPTTTESVITRTIVLNAPPS